MPHRSTHRVVIAGGGVAGVEALLALRELAGARVSITLVTPEPDLVLRPLAVTAPFGAVEERRVDLAAICHDQRVHLRRDALDFVDVQAGAVETARGVRIPYDALLVATGGRREEALRGALTFDGARGIAAMRSVLDDVLTGTVSSIAFALPSGATWPLPLYELALQTATALRGDRGPRITFVTPEADPLAAFGRPARRHARRLLDEAGIELRPNATPLRVLDALLLTSTGTVAADRVVTLPRLTGPRVSGLPADGGGFLPIDEHCAVRGAPGVWAAGDGTDFVVKQGGLAAQQADAAAEAIAAAAGAPCTPEPFRPSLRAQLLTGGMPWWLRAATPSHGAVASRTPLWWPPGKIAARYLAPYLAERVHLHVGPQGTLHDVEAHAGTEEERLAALELAALSADDGGEPLRNR